MKKLLCILLSIGICLSFSACAKGSNSGSSDDAADENKKIQLSQNVIYDGIDFKITDEEGTEWLLAEHIEKAAVTYEESGTRYLELRFTKAGSKKFKKALKKKKGDLSIVVNDKIFIGPITKSELEKDCAYVAGEREEVVRWFNIIT